MLRFILIAVGLLACALGAARAEEQAGVQETELLDSRLADAEAFARYADVSRLRPGASAVDGKGAGGRRGERAALAPRRAPGFLPTRVVPLPAMKPTRPIRPGGRRPVGSSALAVMLVACLAAMREWGWGTERASPAPSLRTTSPPLEDWTLPARPAVPPPAPKPRPPRTEPWQPPDRPAKRVELVTPWWAITYAEQQAIERWDRSVEKEMGMPLNRWLDAHAGDLQALKIWRLKEKLWRDV